MADDKHRDWVDTVSKLLIPIFIFGAGFIFSVQKDKNDRASQQFERDSGILRLTASSNEAERSLGLKIIKVQVERGKFSEDLVPVVTAISQGRPSDASTQAAQDILATAAKDPAIGKQVAPTAVDQTPSVYLQIARDEQRADAGDLRTNLQAAGFAVPGTELVGNGTVNTYVRYFSPNDEAQANKVVALMKNMGFEAATQDFTALNRGKIPSGQMEVWIGEKQGPLPKR